MYSINAICVYFKGRSLLAAFVKVAIAGCCIISAIPVTQADGRPPGPMANSNAPFVAWYQGFNHDTAGWYGSATDGPLGWCGDIEAVRRVESQGSGPAPSAGAAYALLNSGPCNDFWTGLGVPLGAPYAPGPGQSLYSSEWPESGYVTELDIWLDPAWSGEFEGNFGFAGSSPDTLIQYAATIFPTDPNAEPFHTGPHYFVNVDAIPDEEALAIAGYVVEDAGWFTFRFVFSDEAGEARVDFELTQRHGGTIGMLDALEPVNLLGPFKAPFEAPVLTSEYGSGHIWFFDIALGLVLPIDEHRVRRGR